MANSDRAEQPTWVSHKRALPRNHTSASPRTHLFLLLSTMFRPTRLSPSLRQFTVAPIYRGVASVTPKLPEHSHGNLPSSQSPITSTMHFFNSVMEAGKQIPTYRVIDGTGQPVEGAQIPEVCRSY